MKRRIGTWERVNSNQNLLVQIKERAGIRYDIGRRGDAGDDRAK
jgi:hypothetical protein